MTDTLEKPLGAARSHPGQPASPRELIVLVTMGLAVVVALAALLGPWFTVVTYRYFENTVAIDNRGYGLFGYSATDTVPGMNATISGNYLPWPSVRSALLSVQILAALTLVVGLSAVVFTIIGTRRTWPGPLPAILGLSSAALAFVGAVVFATTFPGAAHADGLFDFGASFLGSASVTSANGPLTQTWGPGWAWSGLLSVGVLFLVASLSALRLPSRRPLSEPGF
ncbi:MAG TPA: hypothetical protein VNP71_02370 [Thermoplasmata archaeon]|nr:hypothetical protein [Thermoplasmata archaeon]